MLKKIIPSLIIAVGVYLSTATPTYAESDDACAIWICLPGGFIPGCEKAYVAMIRRITSIPPKFPLPDFFSCFSHSDRGEQSLRLTPIYDTPDFDLCNEDFAIRQGRRHTEILQQCDVERQIVSYGAINITVNGESHSYELSQQEVRLFNACRGTSSDDRRYCRDNAARLID